MFPMHERTQRQICLAAFFLLCAAPTMAVAVWCFAANRPGRMEAEAKRLSCQTGLVVTFGSFESPRPGTLRYQQIVVADPETGETLLECPAIDVCSTEAKDAQGNAQNACVLLAARSKIAAKGLKRLFRVPAAMLTATPGTAEQELRISVESLAIQADRKTHTLHDVQAVIGPLTGGAHAQAVFRIAGVEMREAARMRMVRNRQTAPPVTGFEIDTGGAAIPCEVLALACDELAELGETPRFRGYLWANLSPEGWKGELLGQLSDVDFGALTKSWLRQSMTGVGQVSIQSARFLDGRIEEAAGAVSVGPGLMSRGLFDAAVARLKLPRTAHPPPGATIPYEQLAFGWVLDKSGVRLVGRCDCGAPGTILSDGRNRLLSEPMLQPQPLSALIQTLAPPTGSPVPATREAEWLLRRLPRIEEPAAALQASDAGLRPETL